MPHEHILITCQVRFAPRGRGEIYQRYVSGVFVTLNGSLTCRCRCFDPRFAASLPDSSEQLLTRAARLHHFELTCLQFTLYFLPSAGLNPALHSLTVCFSVIHCLNTHINLLQQRAQLSHELMCSSIHLFQMIIFPDLFRCLCALACSSSLFSLQISSRSQLCLFVQLSNTCYFRKWLVGYKWPSCPRFTSFACFVLLDRRKIQTWQPWAVRIDNKQMKNLIITFKRWRKDGHSPFLCKIMIIKQLLFTLFALSYFIYYCADH